MYRIAGSQSVSLSVRQYHSLMRESRVVSGLLKISQRPSLLPSPSLCLSPLRREDAAEATRPTGIGAMKRPCSSKSREEQLIGLGGGADSHSHSARLVINGTRAEMEALGWRRGRLRDREEGGRWGRWSSRPPVEPAHHVQYVHPSHLPSFPAAQFKDEVCDPCRQLPPSVSSPPPNWLPAINLLETAVQSAGACV